MSITQAPTAGGGTLGEIQARCRWEPRAGAEPPRCWREAASDREKLAWACSTLRHFGVAAAGAQSGLPDEIAARLSAGLAARFPHADGSYLFWTAADDDRCLDGDGRLRQHLTVYLFGPGVLRAASAAFEQAGLAVEVGSPGGVLTVTASASSQLCPPSADRGPVVGVELRGRDKPWQAGPAELRRRLEPTPLRLHSAERSAPASASTAVGEVCLRLVCRDDEGYLTDDGVAEALAALAGRLDWRTLTKLRRCDLQLAQIGGDR